MICISKLIPVTKVNRPAFGRMLHDMQQPPVGIRVLRSARSIGIFGYRYMVPSEPHSFSHLVSCWFLLKVDCGCAAVLT